MNLRERLDELATRRVKAVETPNCGTVYVRLMSGADVQELNRLLKEDEPEERRQAAFLVCGVADEKGQRQFSADDIEYVLDKVPGGDMVTIVNAVNDFNGFNAPLKEAAKN